MKRIISKVHAIFVTKII